MCSFSNTDNSLLKCSTLRFNCSFSISSDVLASRSTRFSRSTVHGRRGGDWEGGRVRGYVGGKQRVCEIVC